MGIIGTYRRQAKGFSACIPSAFPPRDELIISKNLSDKHTEAIRLVGKLDGITELLPDKDYCLEMFVRKDASSSSQIEGTKATMMDAIEAANIEHRFTRQGAYKVIDRLVKMEILSPTKEPNSYGQKYTYRRYVDLFTEDH
jgi:hypothetical protein